MTLTQLCVSRLIFQLMADAGVNVQRFRMGSTPQEAYKAAESVLKDLGKMID